MGLITPAGGGMDWDRFGAIKKQLCAEPILPCLERARLITGYLRRGDNRLQPLVLRRAGALAHLLRHKSALIFPHELIAGNMGGFRRSALVHPEALGVSQWLGLALLGRGAAGVGRLGWRDRLALLGRVLPHWIGRGLANRHGRRLEMGFCLGELMEGDWVQPDYARLLRRGLEGLLAEIDGVDEPPQAAARLAGQGLMDYAARLADEAERLAGISHEARAAELREMARICRKVPARPADTFHEALQALWLGRLAVGLENLGAAASLGRVDQYLYPYYKADLAAGRISRDRARDLLLCFLAKAAEQFRWTPAHDRPRGAWRPLVQAAVVGGAAAGGDDATNDLSWLFCEAMEQLGLAGPKLQIRLHRGASPGFLRRAVELARREGGPALFGDEAALEALASRGFAEAEARDYVVAGRAAPAVPGKDCFAADAGFFNLPLCLELALNQGRRLGSRRRLGAATPSVEDMAGLDDVLEAFSRQVECMVDRMLGQLRASEGVKHRRLPMPFTSLLMDCRPERGEAVAAGGAWRNASGVHCVGLADAVDSLAALQRVVFQEKQATLAQVTNEMAANFTRDVKLLAALLAAPKFGENHPLPDGLAKQVAGVFRDSLARRHSGRDGAYAAGFCSGGLREAFGRDLAALPSGRLAGQPLASGPGPAGGGRGAAALLESVAAMGAGGAPAGYDLALDLDRTVAAGQQGLDDLCALVRGYFRQGGLELRLGVKDEQRRAKARLLEARSTGKTARRQSGRAALAGLTGGRPLEAVAGGGHGLDQDLA